MTLLHREPPGRLEMAGYTLFGLSAIVFAVAVARWATTMDLPDAATASASLSTPQLGERRATSTAGALRMVGADPFHPARSAPASRYLLPDAVDATTVSGPGALRPGAVRLLGTAVLGNGGGFVMAQLGSATPVTVRVGDEVGDLTLRSIRRGEAEFERRDGSLVVLGVPSASTSPPGGRSPR